MSAPVFMFAAFDAEAVLLTRAAVSWTGRVADALLKQGPRGREAFAIFDELNLRLWIRFFEMVVMEARRR